MAIPKSAPFVRARKGDELWHLLEWSRADGVFPVHRMVCKVEFRGSLGGMTNLAESPDLRPRCSKCVTTLTSR